VGLEQFLVAKKSELQISIVRKRAGENNSKNGHTTVKIYHAFPS